MNQFLKSKIVKLELLVIKYNYDLVNYFLNSVHTACQRIEVVFFKDLYYFLFSTFGYQIINCIKHNNDF